jgi:hypothetical protein
MKFIRNIVLTDPEKVIVQRVVKQHGYGERGFSMAIRRIILEWDYYQDKLAIKEPIKVTPETVASMGIVDGPINSTSVIHYTINPEDSNG